MDKIWIEGHGQHFSEKQVQQTKFSKKAKKALVCTLLKYVIKPISYLIHTIANTIAMNQTRGTSKPNQDCGKWLSFLWSVSGK